MYFQYAHDAKSLYHGFMAGKGSVNDANVTCLDPVTLQEEKFIRPFKIPKCLTNDSPTHEDIDFVNW